MDLDIEIQKKYDLSPEKYSPMDTQNVIPQARSSKKTSEPNQHNIMATIPNQGSTLDMKLMQLNELEGDERGSPKHSLHKIDSQNTLGPGGRLQQDSQMTVHQIDLSPTSPQQESLIAAAANAPDIKPSG